MRYHNLSLQIIAGHGGYNINDNNANHVSNNNNDNHNNEKNTNAVSSVFFKFLFSY